MKIRISVLFVLLFSTTYLAQAQWNSWGRGITGEGASVVKEIDLATLEGIALSIGANVYIRQGNSQKIEIKAQQNIIDNIKREVNGGVWKIGFDENVKKHNPITIRMTVKSLEKVVVTGSGDVTGEGAFTKASDMTLSVSGSGGIDLELETGELTCRITGSGDIDAAGNADRQDITITGSGNLESRGLETNDCEVTITGSGDAAVHVKSNLEVRITGSGDVYYKGDPNVRSRVTGSGDIAQRGR